MTRNRLNSMSLMSIHRDIIVKICRIVLVKKSSHNFLILSNCIERFSLSHLRIIPLFICYLT